MDLEYLEAHKAERQLEGVRFRLFLNTAVTSTEGERLYIVVTPTGRIACDMANAAAKILQDHITKRSRTTLWVSGAEIRFVGNPSTETFAGISPTAVYLTPKVYPYVVGWVTNYMALHCPKGYLYKSV